MVEDLLMQLLVSGGGFIAGVISTVIYAKATGQTVRWARRPH